ncbi:MAG: ABC transporter permease [Chloroflexi bacterium]|nr:ABC transporter permease [Chloroflexota bacterium]
MARERALEVGVEPRPRAPGWLTGLRALLRIRLAAVGMAVILIVAILAIFSKQIAPYDPSEQRAELARAAPSWSHLLGGDQLGRDVLSRIIYGSRVALGVGFGAVAFGVLAGVTIGLAGGYFRGVVDEVLMRAMDAIIAFPGLILALVVISVLGNSSGTVIVALAVGTVPGTARIVRAQVLSLREQDYVTAARALGAPATRIMGVHLLPNAFAPIIVIATVSMAFAILAEAALGFLGVGVQPPTPTWGSMLRFSFPLLEIAPWLSIFPGAAIFILVLSWNFVGDALRDILDPRLRGVIR